MAGAKRLQFSFAMEPVEEYDIMSKLPYGLLPLIWVEEGIDEFNFLMKY